MASLRIEGIKRGKKHSKEWAVNNYGSTKTPCCSAVLTALGCENFRVACTMMDVRRVLRRRGYQVRQRNSKYRVRRGLTLGDLRVKVEDKCEARTFVAVHVQQHVLLLGRTGQTIVDTDNHNDKRKVLNIWEVKI